MPNVDALDSAIQELRFLFDQERKRREERKNSLQEIGTVNAAFQDEMEIALGQQVKEWEKRIKTKVEDILRFPPHHLRNLEKLKDFYDLDFSAQVSPPRYKDEASPLVPCDSRKPHFLKPFITGHKLSMATSCPEPRNRVATAK